MVEAINGFVEMCSAFPAQYTQGWYDKLDCVGGSEIHGILSARDVVDCYALVARKVLGAGRVPHVTHEESATTMAVMTGWGTVMEPVLCAYIERRRGAPVLARSSCLFSGNFRFSPDGMIVDGDNALLLEMKNPFMRVWPQFNTVSNDKFEPAEPYTNGCIKDDYYSQVQLGMHLIPFVSGALYVEAIIRRVARSAAGRMYMCGIGMQKMASVRDAAILDRGVISFYGELAMHKNAPYDFENPENDAALIDAFANIRGSISAHYGAPDDAHDAPLFGTMTWALLGVRAVLVKRDEQFSRRIETIGATLDEMVALVNDIRANVVTRDERIAQMCEQAMRYGRTPVATTIRKMLPASEPPPESTPPKKELTITSLADE